MNGNNGTNGEKGDMGEKGMAGERGEIGQFIYNYVVVHIYVISKLALYLWRQLLS